MLLLVRDKDYRYREVVVGLDIASFSYEYEQNQSRSLHFDVNQVQQDPFVFDLIVNESILTWEGQDYVIKECTPQMSGYTLWKSVTAHHISFGCQDICRYEIQEGVRTYTIEEVLNFAFEGNQLGYTWKAIGSFPKVKIENLGDKNALELVNDCMEKFSAIHFSDNKTIILYDETHFYQQTEKQLRYLYNTDDLKVATSTNNLKTQIKCYGKEKENPEKYKGDDKYTAVVLYTSPTSEKWGIRMANSKKDERFTNQTALLSYAKSQLQDVPEVSIQLTYRGKEKVSEREKWFLKHEPMGFETWLKITHLKIPHPWNPDTIEIGFSNKVRDMIHIQARIASSVKNARKSVQDFSSRITSVATIASEAYDSRILSEKVGEVID